VTSRLASLLVQEGTVSAKKMAEAFQRQVIYGGTLDTILLEMDIVDEATLIDALARASQLPTAGDLPSGESLQAAGASRWFPHSVCERFRAVPISLEGNVLRVLVTDPPDRKQLDELGYLLSLSVDPIIVPEHRFMQAVELVYKVPLPARFQSLTGKLRQRAPKVDPTLARVAEVAQSMKPVKLEPPANVVVGTPAKVETYDSALPTITMPTLSPELLQKPPEKPALEPEKPELPRERTIVSDVPMARAPITDEIPVPKRITLEMPLTGRVTQEFDVPRVDEEVQERVPDAPDAPSREMPEQPTPRLTMRQEASPVAQIAAELPARVRDEPNEPTALPLAEAVKLLEVAADRDNIFESVCRGARSLLDFVALFTVQGEQALGRLALSKGWASKDIVGRIAVPLDRPSSLQTTARSHAPFLGRLGDEPVSQEALHALGRKSPMPGVLVPIVLKERTVALLYGDAAGKALDAAVVGDLSSLAGAAARGFQRLILKQKGGEYSKAPGKAAKLSSAPSDEAKGGAWGAAKDPSAGKVKAAAAGGLAAAMGIKEPGVPRSSLHEMPTQQIRQLDQMLDMDALISSVLMSDERAKYSADALAALGERAALAVVARMPGPLKLARHALRGPTPPLAEHGPLLALVARFGKHALGPLLARLNDSSIDVRYYAALAVGELQAVEGVAPLGLRLFDPDTGVRGVAIEGLRRYGDIAEMRVLIESLRGELPGPDPLRQQFAAEALGTMRDAAAVPRLIELVKHDDAAVVLAARHALLDITKQDFGTSRWRWRSWWERHRGEPRVEWMLEGLGHSEAEVRESASEELRTISADNFGYHFDLPKREREEARKRWVDWWRTQKKN
jgi:MshEN domain/HEAT repeats